MPAMKSLSLLNPGLSAFVLVLCLMFASGCAESLAGGRFRAVGPDVVSRFFHRASRLQDGRVMVTGGMYIQFLPPTLVSLDTVSFYDPTTERFSRIDAATGQTPRLLLARSGHTQTTLPDGRVLITGGDIDARGTSPGHPTDDVEYFDPLTGAFAPGPPMDAARSMHTATALSDGRVVIAGGATWQVFDPASGTWSAAIALSRTRSAHAAALLPNFMGAAGEDRVLLAGGGGNGADTLELLNPATGESRLFTSRLTHGVDDLAIARLPDGTVLVVAGQLGSGNTLSLTYRFDPATDALTALSDLPNRPDGLADHNLLLLGGLAFVFGGERQLDNQDIEQDYTAVFDPARSAWTAQGRMRFAHDDFPAVRLSDRAILLIGGGAPLLGQELPSANAEVFELN